MPTPFFADLVRELCQEGGTGPLTPTGAVPGHRRFAGTVPADTQFHYAIAGIAHPDQWETGLGRINGAGRLVRDTVLASSSANAAVDFAPGLKTIALTVGAGWFAALDAAQIAQTAALTAKQPVSTTHETVGAGAATDLATVRRGSGWVNIPLAALAYRDAAGLYRVEGPLGAANGDAAAPSISFAADSNTGLFNPAADAIGFTAGGGERARLTATGIGIGVNAPAARLHVRPANSDTTALVARFEAVNLAGTDYHGLQLSANPASNIVQLASTGTDAGGFAFLGGSSERLRIEANGVIRPGADFAQTLGTSSIRWQEIFAVRLTNPTGALQLAAGTGQWNISQTTGSFFPSTDNSAALCGPANRASVVYAGTNVINTSDAREKRWRGAPSEAELRAARRIVSELGFYQWLQRIDDSGEDGARFHCGVRAQAVWGIMAEEGLVDPIGADGRPGATPYAFLCWDEWEEEGGSRALFGIRPDQLALFLIAGQEARIAALEART